MRGLLCNIFRLKSPYSIYRSRANIHIAYVCMCMYVHACVFACLCARARVKIRHFLRRFQHKQKSRIISRECYECACRRKNGKIMWHSTVAGHRSRDARLASGCAFCLPCSDAILQGSSKLSKVSRESLERICSGKVHRGKHSFPRPFF